MILSLSTILAILTTTLATPSATPPSIARAQAMGIDIYGPIPPDAVRHPDGTYTARPDSLAWAWIRAQVDLPDTPATRAALEQRQGYANVGIGLWAKDGCTGEARYADDVVYGANFYTNVNMYSVGIAYRGLRSNEQLDFSRYGDDGDPCGQYLYSADKDQPKGCFNSQVVNCFRLWVP